MKLLILDIDGVMTDGTKVYDAGYNVIAKRFYDKDFTAIKLFVGAGVDVMFLSADDRVNRGMADSRGIMFWYTRDKVGVLSEICTTRNIEIKDVCFVGDDITDEPIMDAIVRGGGKVYCPSDAWPSLLRNDDVFTLNAEGGHGVVMVLYDRIHG